MDIAAQVSEPVRELDILAAHRDSVDGSIQDVVERLDLGFDPGDTKSQWLRLLAQRLESPCQDRHGLREDDCIVGEVKISDLFLSERSTAAALVRHPSQYPVHASAEKSGSEDAPLTNPSINWEELRGGASTLDRAHSSRIQFGYQM
jgi:hypothetical protein